VWHIIELVKSLPVAEQQAICVALARYRSELRTGQAPTSTPGFGETGEGIPNDHPFFTILEADEADRRREFGPPAPEFA
jgi:hypothetical protein